VPEPYSLWDLHLLIIRQKLKNPYKYSDACWSSFAIVTQNLNTSQMGERNKMTFLRNNFLENSLLQKARLEVCTVQSLISNNSSA
jgi:hypothetical protein